MLLAACMQQSQGQAQSVQGASPPVALSLTKMSTMQSRAHAVPVVSVSKCMTRRGPALVASYRGACRGRSGWAGKPLAVCSGEEANTQAGFSLQKRMSPTYLHLPCMVTREGGRNAHAWAPPCHRPSPLPPLYR